MDELQQLPCPFLSTDTTGRVLAINSELLALLGGNQDDWLNKPMDNLFPLPSRIFLQTHIWPMLLREETVREIRLQICDSQNHRLPVLVNCKKAQFQGVDCYFWVLFVTVERSRFEVELLEARRRAEASATALTQSEKFVHTITDAMTGPVAYWDAGLYCRFANKTYQAWLGKTSEQVIGMPIKDLLGERLVGLNLPYIQRAMAGESQSFERTLTKGDGIIVNTLTNYVPDFDSHGQVMGMFVIVTDLTVIKRAEEALRMNACVFDNAHEGIMITDAQGTIISVNPAFTQITGYSSQEVLGGNPRLLKSGRHDAVFYAGLWQALTQRERWDGEIWNRHKNGSEFLERQSISVMRGEDGLPMRYIAVFSDITERWEKEELIRHLALHDALTGMPNRAMLLEHLNQLLATTQREQRNLALLFLDLDQFKLVNDRLGHAAGDTVLKLVAQKLRALVRQADIVARLGGDEFVVLLDNPSGQDEVEQIASRIVAAINEPMSFDGHTAHVGTSIGIAMHPVDGTCSTDLLKNADTAMYAAKKSGKNTYRFFQPVG